MFTLKNIKEQSKKDKRTKHNIVFIIASKNPAESFEYEKESFNFVMLFVTLFTYSQGFLRFFLGNTTGSNTRSMVAVQSFSPSYGRSISRFFAPFPAGFSSAAQYPRKHYLPDRRIRKILPLPRSDHKNFGGELSSGSSDGLYATCFEAPVSPRCTFTVVLSMQTLSALISMIPSCCIPSSTCCSTPLLLVQAGIHRMLFPVFLRQCPPFAAVFSTYSNTLANWRLTIFTFLLCHDKYFSISLYCSFVISISLFYFFFTF